MNLRMAIKRSVKWLFLILALPLFGLFLATRSLSGSDKCFTSFSQLLSLIPGKAGVYLRAAFYKLACPDTSDEISVGFLTILSHRDTSVGRGVYIGPQCNIGMCRIGENTLIGSGVHILSGSRQHSFEDTNTPIQEQGGQFEKITIGADCWIGNSAILMANLADHSIVAAGGVLTKTSNKPGSILAGNPASLKRDRLQQTDNTSEDTNHEKSST